MGESVLVWSIYRGEQGSKQMLNCAMKSAQRSPPNDCDVHCDSRLESSRDPDS